MGNPFVIGKDGTRAEVIAKYEAWIIQQPELMASLHELTGKDLVCWCVPEACHAEVLLRLANPSFAPFRFSVRIETIRETPVKFKPIKIEIDVTPFQKELAKQAGMCLLGIPFAIVSLMGFYAIYEWLIQMLWGLINLGQFRTYTLAKLAAQVSFITTIIFIVAKYVHHVETAKKSKPKTTLVEAA